MIIADTRIIKWASGFICFCSLVSFIRIGIEDFWNTIKFIYQWFASILSHRTIDSNLSIAAKSVFSEFVHIIFTCITVHIGLAIVAFTMTGSRYIVNKHLERDEELHKALQNKISIQERHLKLHKTLQNLETEAQKHMDNQKVLHKNLLVLSKTITTISQHVGQLKQSVNTIERPQLQTAILEDGDF